MTKTELTSAYLWDRLPSPLKGFRAIIAGVVSAALTTALCVAIANSLPSHAAAMIYFLAVVGSAVAFGMLAGLAAATASFLAYNYFFLQPTYTFTIYAPGDLVALLIFFAVAILVASLAGRLREVAEQARQRSRSLEVINSLALRLADAASAEEIANLLADEASRASGRPARVLNVDGAAFGSGAQTADAPPLTSADVQAARRCVTLRQTVYPAAFGWSDSHYEFRPLLMRDKAAAVLGIHQISFSEADSATIDALVRQAALGWERMLLKEERAAAEHQAESERLRSALLSSVSHDLKTPLAVIQGAVTSLRELGAKMPEDSKLELVATIEEETAHLSRFVSNILDMMRFEAAAAEVPRDWIDLADILGTTVIHARKLLPQARLRLDVQVAPAIIRGDETLLDHVFLNVIENAAAAAPPETEIRIVLQQGHDGYRVGIEDAGEGIPADVLPRIFDKFYRAPGSKRRGSGLGLTICRQVMLALGGRIAAESPVANGRGTRITLDFPADQPAMRAGEPA